MQHLRLFRSWHQHSSRCIQLYQPEQIRQQLFVIMVVELERIELVVNKLLVVEKLVVVALVGHHMGLVVVVGLDHLEVDCILDFELSFFIKIKYY